MTVLMSSRLRRLLLSAAVSGLYSTAFGGGEFAVSPPELGAGPAAIGPAATGVAGGVYNEYNSYGAYVRRSYVPGYIPQTDSLFENPRTLPASLCKFSDYYRFANVNGWFFASPNGYQSSVPEGSLSHKFVSGQLGITSSLQYGYPRGMRVIEPVIVPFSSYSEPAGLFITSEGIAVRPGVAPAPAPLQQVTQTVQQTVEKTGAPEPAPAFSPMPSLPEVIEK